jgi:phage-related protein
MEYKFRVIFLEEAKEFLDELDEKSSEKLLYNIWKSRTKNDPELFKKLDDEIWEFRTKYAGKQLRLFAFWDKIDKEDTIVISTHGIIKKTSKTPKNEISKAKKLMIEYFNDKNKEDENI